MNKIQKLLSIVFFVAILVVLIYLVQNYGIEPLRIKVESMGFWAPLGIFILRGISIILPALPSSAYSLLAGSLLGFQKGYITIIFSDIVFCQIAFFIARYFGRKPVLRLVGTKAMKKIESFNQNQLEENFFLMTGLLMTGLFDFLSYAIGIGGTRWKIFTPALLISLLISDSILVAVGAGVSQGAGLFLGMALLGMFALATISGLSKNPPQWLIKLLSYINEYISRFLYSLTKGRSPIWFINLLSYINEYISRFLYSLTKGKSQNF